MFEEYKPEVKRLDRQEVVNYLVRLKTDGYDVRSLAFGFAFEVGNCLVEIYPKENLWGVSYTRLTVLSTLGEAGTLQELDFLVGNAVSNAGVAWPSRPTSGRLGEATPASNFKTISSLIGSASIKAVFDPYLDNASLVVISDILSFGDGSVASGVRLLGSVKKTAGTNPRFTRAGVLAWLSQGGIAGEARSTSSTTEHRRFILLSGGKSLILGPSVNSIHKNEAVLLENDTDDRPFFDSVWSQASPI